MDKFRIDDRGVEDARLEFPINNWLAEQGKLDILAGSISHPIKGEPNEEDGTLFMTQFARLSHDGNHVLQEREIDLRLKDWLINQCAVNADELEWISLQDRFNLTISGIYPRRNDIRGTATHRIVPADMMERWTLSDKDLEGFFEGRSS